MNQPIAVPPGMLKAAREATGVDPYNVMPKALEAALGWLRENPIEPTREQANELYDIPVPADDQALGGVIAIAVEWQRRMFLAPEESQCQNR